MELATALPEDDNSYTITMLKAVKDNDLLNKPVVHAQTILRYYNCIAEDRLQVF